MNIYFYNASDIELEFVNSLVSKNHLNYTICSNFSNIESLLYTNTIDLLIIIKDKTNTFEINSIFKKINNSDILFIDSLKNINTTTKLELENLLYKELVYFELNNNSVHLKNTKINNGFFYNSKIPVATIDKIMFIATEKIISCKADGKYTIFVLKNEKEIISSRNLGEYENLLNPNIFFRIHHKYLVNMDHIKTINKKDGYYCELTNGENLPIAKRRQEEFNKFIRLKI